MNCFNHPEEAAVASCIDCGKGLCKSCASLYDGFICSECNLKRVKSDKGKNLRVYLPSIILFILGFVFGFSMGVNIRFVDGVWMGFVLGWVFGGIPWGWDTITFIQPRIFLILPIVGWILYLCLKLFLSIFIGCVALPIGVVVVISRIISTKKKEENIMNNIKT
jgi:hypothetical protein